MAQSWLRRGLPHWIVTALAAAALVNTFVQAYQLDAEHRRTEHLAAHIEALDANADAVATRKELERTQWDVDVCHLRLDDYWVALSAVAATQPGRARPPFVPVRERPDKPEEDER